MQSMDATTENAPDGGSERGPHVGDNEITIAYQPIIRGAAVVCGLYYLSHLAIRLLNPETALLGVMVPLDALGAATGLAVRLFLSRPRSPNALEVCGGLLCLNLFVTANTPQLFDFQAENLIYIALIMPVSAAVLPRRTLTACAVALCLGTLLWLVHRNLPDELGSYIPVGMAGVAAAASISLILRSAVLNSVKARLEAVRDRETAEELAREARHLAQCDALTGLPNRRSFFIALNERLTRLRDKGETFVLGLVDLDGFKPVNDTYGHAAGDEMLKAVAQRLRDTIGDAALPARLGGDEFAFIAPLTPATAEGALTIGQRIEARLAEPHMLGGFRCKGSGSVGLLICDDPALGAQQLMERADHALYFAKRALQGKAVLFNAALEQEMMTSSQIDKALRRCDHDAEFEVYFQPQFDLSQGRIVGFEALARWNSPDLGRVTPDIFIPAAERAGLIRPLTRALLGKALGEMANWPDDLSLSFNLSTHDLMSPHTMDEILETVRASGLSAERIEFEITETAMMSDFAQAQRAIDRISQAGHSVALDDFGIGYSSLQYLQQLTVSKLKIDHSFVRNILNDTSSYKIVRTLLSLSHTLGLGCVVEGVESEAQMHILRTMGARHVQGYLIGAPMPAADLPDCLSQRFEFGAGPPSAPAQRHRHASAQ